MGPWNQDWSPGLEYYESDHSETLMINEYHPQEPDNLNTNTSDLRRFFTNAMYCTGWWWSPECVYHLPTSVLVRVFALDQRSRLRHTVMDIHVTSFPPRWQFLWKMLTFSGSKLSLAWTRTTPRDLDTHRLVPGPSLVAKMCNTTRDYQTITAAPRAPTARSTRPSALMSRTPWILWPKYFRPAEKVAAERRWRRRRRENQHPLLK